VKERVEVGAGKEVLGRNIHTIKTVFAAINLYFGNLQTLLAENKEHEIDDIGGQPMEEQHIDVMMDFICGYTSILIPEPSLHWILIANLFAHLNYLTPLHLSMIGTRDIVHGNIHRPLLHCELIRNNTETIDGIIHRYDLRFVACIDKHGSNDAFARANHKTSWSI